MAEKYFGSFGGREDMASSFLNGSYSKDWTVPEDFPSEESILFASYGGACYEGDAVVLFEQDGKLFEVRGSHCSCYGLEGQWEPTETSWEELKMRPTDGRYHFLIDHDGEAVEAFRQLVKR